MWACVRDVAFCAELAGGEEFSSKMGALMAQRDADAYAWHRRDERARGRPADAGGAAYDDDGFGDDGLGTDSEEDEDEVGRAGGDVDDASAGDDDDDGADVSAIFAAPRIVTFRCNGHVSLPRCFRPS